MRCGLRVVDDHEVVVAFEQQRVVEDLLEVDALHRRRPLDVGALQAVVDGLRDGEELVAAVHHLPVGIDADAAEQGDVGGEQLGDAAAVRGGVEVEHPRPRRGCGELADPFDDIAPDDARVVVEVLFEQRDAVEHGALRWCTSGAGISVNLSTDALLHSCAPTSSRARSAPAAAATAMAAGTAARGLRGRPRAAARRRRRGHARRVARGARRIAPSGDGHRAARGSGRRPSGRCSPAASRSSRWRAPAASRSSPAAKDPLRASTRGTGELIAAALRAGARRVIVGVGGSATTDGGLAGARSARVVVRLDRR